MLSLFGLIGLVYEPTQTIPTILGLGLMILMVELEI